jgi:predicted DNA binding CopG/RHH family protein
MSKEKTYTLSEEAYRNKLEYIAEYNKKMSRITIQVSPEEKERIKALASDKGMSVKDLILSALWVYEA